MLNHPRCVQQIGVLTYYGFRSENYDQFRQSEIYRCIIVKLSSLFQHYNNMILYTHTPPSMRFAVRVCEELYEVECSISRRARNVRGKPFDRLSALCSVCTYKNI